MSAFEHLLTLVSFVLALSMATILLFAATLYRRRREVRLSAPHALWTLIIFLNQIGFWLGAYNFHERTTATYAAIAFIVVQPVILFLQSAFVVTGDQGPFDLRAHHIANGRAYLALLLLGALTEAAFMAHMTGLDPDIDLGFYFLLQGAGALAVLFAILLKSGAVQILAPALLLALQLANIFFASDTLVGAR